jgi:hypothetical protein
VALISRQIPAGSWVGPAACTANACSAPPVPANGALSPPTGTTGSVSTYSCNAGFQLVGATTTTCQASGTWSAAVPVCNGPGSSSALPALSCAAMKAANSAIVSGIYWLQLPGVNGNAPFQIFCDFVMDGGV